MARILLADDAAIVRALTRQILESAGHDVVGEAATGDDAVRLFDDLRPDLAVLDVNMPSGDGISASEEIRRRHPVAPLVLASVLMNEGRRTRIQALGRTSSVQKPFEPAVLLAVIEDALAA